MVQNCAAHQKRYGMNTENRRFYRFPFKTSSFPSHVSADINCHPSLGDLTIPELMGLVCSFFFLLAGSIEPQTIPAPTAHSSPWPNRTYPPGHTPVGPWINSFHALHSAGHKSLFHSFAIFPCVHYRDLLDVRCPIYRARDVNFWCRRFVCISSLGSSFHISYFLLSFLFLRFLSHLSFTAFSLLHSSTICLPFLFLSKSPNVLYWRVQFIASTFLMVEVQHHIEI